MTQELKVLLIIGVITAVAIIGAIFFLGKSTPSSQNNIGTGTKVPANLLNSLERADNHKISTDSAKVTVVEFSDLECPACATAQPIVKRILEDERGKINFIYRHFPLPQHTKALDAIKAAEAAGEQGKFWEMHDKLFATQEAWTDNNDFKNLFVSYAQELGLDTTKFKTDMESTKYDAKINEDKNDGFTLGVNSTPTFFINDQKYPGILPYDEFKTAIESAGK
ncbi:MAG: DsbA family protein [bacterium]|nr:DsbA family protein [bacterium]